MKRLLLPSLLLALAFSPVPASALTGTDDFKSALNEYLDFVDRMIKDAPGVENAAQFAALLDQFATQNAKLAAAMKKFAQANPEVVKMKDPPPELKETMDRLATLKNRREEMTSVIAPLGKKYNTDPAVKKALEKLGLALEGVKDAGN